MKYLKYHTDLKHILSFYIIAIGARHAHPEQKHRNKRNYNRKPGISDRKKLWNLLYRLWGWRPIHAYWLCCIFESFGCHGANALEQLHSICKNILLFLKYEGISLKRLAPIAAIQKLYILHSRLHNLLHINGAKLATEYPDDVEMLNRMYTKLEQIRGFNDLYSGYDEFGHKIMYYDDISIKAEDYLDNIVWRDALKSTTTLNDDDTDNIWRFINDNEDDFINNSGWMKDKSKLDKLSRILSKDINHNDLKDVLYNYWFAPDTDTDDDIDMDDEDDIYRRLSSKKKKLDELSDLVLWSISCILLILYNNLNRWKGPAPEHGFRYDNNDIKSPSHDHDIHIFHQFGSKGSSAQKCREIYTGLTYSYSRETKRSIPSKTPKAKRDQRGKKKGKGRGKARKKRGDKQSSDELMDYSALGMDEDENENKNKNKNNKKRKKKKKIKKKQNEQRTSRRSKFYDKDEPYKPSQTHSPSTTPPKTPPTRRPRSKRSAVQNETPKFIEDDDQQSSVNGWRSRYNNWNKELETGIRFPEFSQGKDDLPHVPYEDLHLNCDWKPRRISSTTTFSIVDFGRECIKHDQSKAVFATDKEIDKNYWKFIKTKLPQRLADGIINNKWSRYILKYRNSPFVGIQKITHSDDVRV